MVNRYLEFLSKIFVCVWDGDLKSLVGCEMWFFMKVFIMIFVGKKFFFLSCIMFVFMMLVGYLIREWCFVFFYVDNFMKFFRILYIEGLFVEYKCCN